MRLLVRFFLAALLAFAFSIPALAETRDVPANRPSIIFAYGTYVSDTCAYGSKPRFKILKQPEHGTITATWQAYRMGKDTRNCAGKPTRGMVVVYRPNKGYRGPDKVKFVFSGSGVYPGEGFALTNGFTVNINVR